MDTQDRSVHDAGREDRLAELIRLGGRQEPIPRDRAARVQAATREHWHAQVRRRRRTRLAWTGAGLAAAAALTLAVGLPAWLGTQPAALGRVLAVSHRAWAQGTEHDGAPARATVGHGVHEGMELLTETGSRLALRLDSGVSLRMDTDTRLRLISMDVVELERGAVYVDSGPEGRGPDVAAIRIRTDMGTIQDIGTQFEVRVEEGSLRVRVREGRVIVGTDAGSHEVALGEELWMAATGNVERTTLPVHGAPWAWVGAITPMMDLEGRSARAFLDWVSRERGWELRFTAPAVERTASETILSGSAEGLGLEDALAAVLPTCRLAHRVEGGTLVVEHLGEEKG